MNKLVYEINEQSTMYVSSYENYHKGMLEVLEYTSADSVVIDIDTLEPGEVLSFTKELQQKRKKIIILTEKTKDVHLLEYIEAGADSMIDKNDPIERIITAIQSEHAVFSPDIIPLFMKKYNTEQQINKNMFATRLKQNNIDLTQREQDVAFLLKEGLKNEAIGRILGIGEGTVSVHISGINKKIGRKQRRAVIQLLGAMMSTTITERSQ
ncbi:LuxR C-terminal-related transcriptional regulator [Virgibacillus ainsalahensis]